MHNIQVEKGIVKWFDQDKGYGFIARDDIDVFVHYSQIKMTGFKTLNKGDLVSYVLEKSDKGPQAKCVIILESSKQNITNEFIQ